MIGLLGRWISQNPYKVLGLSRNATPKEIREAYLNLARKYHPDVAPSQIVILIPGVIQISKRGLPYFKKPSPHIKAIPK
jgi:hypothetical protein